MMMNMNDDGWMLTTPPLGQQGAGRDDVELLLLPVLVPVLVLPLCVCVCVCVCDECV
jgi:hypothetical protein